MPRKWKHKSPWYDWDNAKVDLKDKKLKIAIIGGGIAGCSLAFLLNDAGYSNVVLFEKNEDVALCGSGNKTGIFYPLITSQWNDTSEFYFESLKTVFNFLKKYLIEHSVSHDWCGMLALPKKERERIKWPILPKNLGFPESELQYLLKEEAEKKAGYDLNEGGLYFPNAGWVSPKELVHSFINDESIEVCLNKELVDLNYESDQFYLKFKDQSSEQADLVFLCNAKDVEPFIGDDALSLKEVRGQVSYVKSKEPIKNLKTVLCYSGYTAPAHEGIHHVGATFDPKDSSLELRTEDHQKNLDLFFNYTKKVPLELAGGRVGFRCVTPDRLPIIGPVHDLNFYREHYFDLGHGRHWKDYPQGKYIKNLFVNAGHGSRGLISALWGSLLLVKWVNQEVLQSNINYEILHPARFFVKKLRRQNYDSNQR